MVVSRVPTHITQNNYTSRMMVVQSRIADLTYSVTSKQKSATYAGISKQTLSLFNYETQKMRTEQFVTNNNQTKTKLSTMNLALEAVQKNTTDFRSTLRSLLELDLKNITPDYNSTPPKTLSDDTANTIRNVQQQAFNALKAIEDALNVQANGEYVFSGGKTGTQPINFPFSSLEEFQKYYDGQLVKYPESSSANLSSYKTEDSITGGFTLSQDITRLGYDDAGNPVAVAGAFQFNWQDNKITANAGTFSDIKEGGLIKLTGTLPAGLNDGDYIVSSVSADGSTVRIDSKTPLKAPEIPTYTGGMNGATPVTMLIEPSDSAITTTVDFSVTNTSITLDHENNKIVADKYYTFSNVKAGDKITLGNTSVDPYGSGVVNNDITFTVSGVSADGKEIYLDAGAPINKPNIPDGAMTGAVGDLTITQDMNEGFIDAVNPNGSIITTLNTGGNNATFAGNTITVDPLAMPNFFKNVKAGQTIEISGSGAGNNGTYYVTDINYATGTVTVDAALNAEVQNNISVDVMSLEHGFVSENILGGNETTGTLFFNTAKNQMIAENENAFSTLKAGDTIVLNGTANNNGVKYIKSVSADGKTITFEDSTPVQAEGVPIDPPFNEHTRIVDGTGVNIGKTYSIGSTVSLGNIDPAYNGEYTVVGVADNGNRLIVKTNSFPKPPLTTASITYPANGKMSVSSTSYYQGDKLATDIRVDENTVLNIGITGEDGAFEKVIRALCMIAQGNLVDERNPMDAPDGVDANRALERVTEAMNLLDDALSHNNIKNSSESKSDLTQLNYKVGLNLKNVSTKITTQETLVKYLEDNIDGIEKMNPTEAAQLLQEQVTILEYSYAALSTVNSLSLMNYLK